MILSQVLVVSLLAASNTQVSTTRINTQQLVIRSRMGNGATVRVGVPTWNEQTRTFTAPTDPLSDTSQNTFTLEPGESFEVPIASWNVEHGEYFNLERFYVQGPDNKAIEFHYNIIVQA